MRSRKYLAVAIAASFLSSGRACLGTAVPPLRISDLVSQSDVVVVADVSEIRPAGLADVDLGGISVSAQRYSARAVARYNLEGTCPDEFSVEFVLPTTSTGYKSVKPGTRILFLKHSGTMYSPTDPYYPDLPAIRSDPYGFQSNNATELVFAELAAVVASVDASPGDKWEVLSQSYSIPDGNKSFLGGLRVGVRNAGEPELRRRIQAELIGRNDVSEFSDVCNALLTQSVATAPKAVLLYEIGQRLKSEKAVPGLTRLLQSPELELRIASAQALWHVASASSIGALTGALNDQSPDVRYYAIRGLADITGELQWGPSIAEYHEHEAKYRQYWMEWASQNSAPLTNN
jgi:hypothetical protein